MPVVELSTDSIPSGSRAAWGRAQRLRIPGEVASLFGLASDEPGPFREVTSLPAILREHAVAVRMARAYTRNRPTSSRLPVSYQVAPPLVRKLVASAMGRWKRHSTERWAAFPRWPIDLSADLLMDLAGEGSPFADGPTPVLMSHDIDSPEGLSNLLSMFLDVEEQAGARSANYIVPCAWPIDHGLLGEVHARGHEIGVHGFDHANRTPFVSRVERRCRIQAARELIERYAIKGYRAPSLLRTPELLSDLADHYTYDSSIPTSGGLFPVPNNGCASARPFQIGGLVEIPVSMPRDGSLRFLGYSPADVLRVWLEAAELIACSGGVVVLLTHCEKRFSGNSEMLAVYRELLNHFAGNRRFKFSTTSDVLNRYAAHESGSQLSAETAPAGI